MTALNMIADLDDGQTVSPTALTLLESAEQDASNRWYRIDRQVESWQASVCVVCGGPDGPECGSCTVDWDKTVDRAGDL